MFDGGKNNVTFITEIYQENVYEFDPGDRITDIFFFDGASNFQKNRPNSV